MTKARKAERRAKDTPVSVAVGYLYGQDVAAGFANSLAAMLWFQARANGPVADVFAEPSGVNVAAGRNTLMQQLLDSECDWLLMLDADMTFRPDLPQALLAHADPASVPVVGGLCFGIDDGVLFPTLYEFTENDGRLETVRYHDYPDDALFPVGATGAACLLIHRDVATAVAAAKYDAVFPWFQETAVQGQRFGEDMTFALRCAASGIPIHVATGVHVGHQKAHVLTAEQFRSQRQRFFEQREATSE